MCIYIYNLLRESDRQTVKDNILNEIFQKFCN